jgi:hypothetical protein
MFDLTLVSSSSEKLLSISGEKVGRLVGWGEEDEREEVMRVQSRLRSGLIPSITETRSLQQHT